MVSLVHPLQLEEIKANWKTNLFYQFIQGNFPDNNKLNLQNTTDSSFFSFAHSISSNNRKAFEKTFLEFSQRKPSKENPWLYDNFLIFVISVGVVKYNLDKTWLLRLINLRESKNLQLSELNLTFKNLLNSNFSSKENLFELVFVFQELTDTILSPTEEINPLFSKLVSDNYTSVIKDPFLKLLSLRTIEIIIFYKELPNMVEIQNLKSFKRVFVKRIKIVSKIVYLLLIIFLIAITYIIYSQSEAMENNIQLLSTILGILGFGLLALIKWLSRGVEIIILHILGYTNSFKL